MRVKELRALRLRRERELTGLFLAEGTHVVAEAIALHAPIELLVAAPELLRSAFALELLRRSRAAGVPILELPARAFAAVVADDGRHALAAVVRQRWRRLADLAPTDTDLWVALDAVQYPGNLGTVMRTAEAVGAAGVLLLDRGADPYDPAAVRASLGAVFALGLVRARFDELRGWARVHGARLLGSSPAGTTDYRSAGYQRPLVLLLGSERSGLDPGQLAACHEVVRIPMEGRGDSLNLGVAAGLLLYEARAKSG